MKALLLMRHGRAESSSPDGDRGRALTKEGQVEVDRVAAGIARAVGEVDHILHSPYLRARQTAERMQAAVKGALVEDASFIPDGHPEEAFEVVRTHARGRLLVVSHLPLLPALTGHLLNGTQLSFTPATVARVGFLGLPRPNGAIVTALWPPETWA